MSRSRGAIFSLYGEDLTDEVLAGGEDEVQTVGVAFVTSRDQLFGFVNNLPGPPPFLFFPHTSELQILLLFSLLKMRDGCLSNLPFPLR